MATIGQQLLTPEPSWKRYDDTNNNIIYEGSGWTSLTGYNGFYSGTGHYNNTLTTKIRFKFKGTKLRFIHYKNNNYSNNIKVNIDGVLYNYNAYNASILNQVLVFEVLNLPNRVHYVEVYNNQSGLFFECDAIDIDDTGELVDINTSLFITKHLIKSDGQFKVLVGEIWTDILLLEPLSKADFETHGMDNLSSIPLEKWNELDNEFEVITWTDDLDTDKFVEIETEPFVPIQKLNQETNFEVLTYSGDHNVVTKQVSGVEQVVSEGKMFKTTLDNFKTITNVSIT